MKNQYLGNLSLNKIYLGDALSLIKKIPNNSIDITIVDPPYNLSKGSKIFMKNIKQEGFGGDWKKTIELWDNLDLKDYFNFTMSWLTEVKRVTKTTGSIWIHGTYHNIGIINTILQILNIEIINEVIWFKRNSFPNLAGRRLTASHENILWCHTGGKKRKYIFNYDYSKKSHFDEDKIKIKNKQMRTVWDIPNNKKKEELLFGKHPTQKPVRLIDRIIKLSSKKGNILLSPFAGAGTDCIVAKNNKLNFIGFELEKKYFNIAIKRLK